MIAPGPRCNGTPALEISCLFHVDWFFEKIDITFDSFAAFPTTVSFILHEPGIYRSSRYP